MKLMVITGASSGVGRAAALRFASEGYTVCALARSANKLDELAMEVAGKIYPYPTDVSDSKSVERTFAKIIEDHGILDRVLGAIAHLRPSLSVDPITGSPALSSWK